MEYKAQEHAIQALKAHGTDRVNLHWLAPYVFPIRNKMPDWPAAA
jgi:hypothetical protein